jgi:hypothetical protein
MFRMAPLLVSLLALACNRGPDPLAEQRKTCQQLADSKSLKAGLTVDECAKQLKAAEPPKVEAASAVASPKTNQNP